MEVPNSPCASSGSPAPLGTTKHIKTHDEDRVLEMWDADILRAARRATERAGLGALHPAADDMAQEARVRLLRALRLRSVRAEAYLRCTVSNAIKNAARDEFRAPRVPLDGEDALEVDGGEPQDVLARIKVAGWIETLPEPLAVVYGHLYIQEASQREAARAMGISQPRVAQLHRDLLQRGHRELAHLAA